jgi:aminoglycoside 2''-phosphotransferase
MLAVVPGPLGVARMGCRLVGGVGLSAAVTSRLKAASRRRLVTDLVAILDTLATSSTAAWPTANQSWPQRWGALTDRLARDVVPLITSSDQRSRARMVLAAARAAADSCSEVGLTHGDLGGENVHVDPVSGAVLGILDWDEAGPGDPAVDLAAMLVHAEPWLHDALLAHGPRIRALADRARAYTDTFALQEALWGLEDGDSDAVDRGLARYR